MKELWKSIIGYEGCYEVSSTGRIRRISTGKFLKPNLSGAYTSITLCMHGQTKDFSIHVLTCLSFNGEKPTPKHEVNHKNGIKRDNFYKNLEWVTKSEQQRHRFRVLKQKGSMFGKKHTEKTMEKLRQVIPWNLGRQHSDETKNKIREKATGRIMSPETREKMRVSALRRSRANHENLLIFRAPEN